MHFPPIIEWISTSTSVSNNSVYNCGQNFGQFSYILAQFSTNIWFKN